MDLHGRLHTGEMKFMCEICGSAFLSKSTLKKHNKLIHRKPRSFVCKFCDKRFNTQDSWNKHVKSTHKEKMSKEAIEKGDSKLLFQCAQCNYLTNQKELLLDHMHDKHREADMGAGASMYDCHLCGWKTVNYTTYQKHLTMHRIPEHEIMERQVTSGFQCAMCSFNTDMEEEYKTHLFMVHKCDMCGQVFTLQEELMTHRDEHEEENRTCRVCCAVFQTLVRII